jgi:hypothetical protein
VDTTGLLDLGKQLIEIGSERGVTLRILGHLAIRDHVKDHIELLELLNRVPTHDIDFIGYSIEQTQAERMFTDLGYEVDPSVAFSQEYGLQRLIFHHHENEIMAEIFLDQLIMSHTLDFRGRLELDHPTISLVDLLLSKLQIQEISEKDIKDMIALFAEHELGSDGRELIDISYLLRLTRTDWGLFYTAKKNLDLVKKYSDRYSVIDASTRQSVKKRLDKVLISMMDEPKTVQWKLRAKIGTRLKWYQDVSDVQDIHR